jgi:KaiC/GvpD/RAD55 family RecA-like ATPase
MEFKKILQQRKFVEGEAIPIQRILLKIDDRIIGTTQSFVIISGSPKTGKSTYTAALLASAINKGSHEIFKIKLQPLKERNKVAFFDTESSIYDFHKQIERLKKLANIKNLPKNFSAYNFREDNPIIILQLIETYLKENLDCSVIVIDGILDLLYNYNDEVESRNLIIWLKKITKIYDILVVGILHTGKNSNETLGHLGSNTDRWAQSTLLVQRNKETEQLILSSKFLRSDRDFEPIAIKNIGGTYYEVDYIEESKKTYKKS